jgi:uncharacterized Tic20 family protein
VGDARPSLPARHIVVLTAIAFAIPLVMWLVKKDKSSFIDDHGREALNFQITLLHLLTLADPGVLGLR